MRHAGMRLKLFAIIQRTKIMSLESAFPRDEIDPELRARLGLSGAIYVCLPVRGPFLFNHFETRLDGFRFIADVKRTGQSGRREQECCEQSDFVSCFLSC